MGLALANYPSPGKYGFNIKLFSCFNKRKLGAGFFEIPAFRFHAGEIGVRHIDFLRTAARRRGKVIGLVTFNLIASKALRRAFGWIG